LRRSGGCSFGLFHRNAHTAAVRHPLDEHTNSTPLACLAAFRGQHARDLGLMRGLVSDLPAHNSKVTTGAGPPRQDGVTWDLCAGRCPICPRITPRSPRGVGAGAPGGGAETQNCRAATGEAARQCWPNIRHLLTPVPIGPCSAVRTDPAGRTGYTLSNYDHGSASTARAPLRPFATASITSNPG
jgi:hypothetical protein